MAMLIGIIVLGIALWVIGTAGEAWVESVKNSKVKIYGIKSDANGSEIKKITDEIDRNLADFKKMVAEYEKKHGKDSWKNHFREMYPRSKREDGKINVKKGDSVAANDARKIFRFLDRPHPEMIKGSGKKTFKDYWGIAKLEIVCGL